MFLFILKWIAIAWIFRIQKSMPAVCLVLAWQSLIIFYLFQALSYSSESMPWQLYHYPTASKATPKITEK